MLNDWSMAPSEIERKSSAMHVNFVLLGWGVGTQSSGMKVVNDVKLVGRFCRLILWVSKGLH